MENVILQMYNEWYSYLTGHYSWAVANMQQYIVFRK